MMTVNDCHDPLTCMVIKNNSVHNKRMFYNSSTAATKRKQNKTTKEKSK
jgi:hypothetical protein